MIWKYEVLKTGVHMIKVTKKYFYEFKYFLTDTCKTLKLDSVNEL